GFMSRAKIGEDFFFKPGNLAKVRPEVKARRNGLIQPWRAAILCVTRRVFAAGANSVSGSPFQKNRRARAHLRRRTGTSATHGEFEPPETHWLRRNALRFVSAYENVD